ncbi:MAG TPA: LLM class flavin-dependent oxidoreductase [Methylomirabilota bacterium]|jgi:alkanesulfonate monooxygenase SsuD/methylene tetrahydromethanopterin reductase-like flavin-dependent oxidoreductase (luciferase family)
MSFGLFYLMQRDEQWSEQSVYDSDVRQMLAAEALGYTSVWIAEHHFNDYGLCPAPTVLAAYVAARTTTLRVGMGVSLLPLHHPVDLAEQLAVLDVVSGGRLDVGIGRGGTLQDYQTFQSDRDDSRARVEEGIALMQRCWSGAPFDFAGRFHTAERLHVRPRPIQRPHPPLYIAANSEDSVVSAARLGLPALSSFFVPVPELQRRHTVYRDASLATGRSETEIGALERQGWGMRVVHVAPTREEALRATEGPFMGYQRKMAVLRSDATGGSVPSSFDRSLLRLRSFPEYLADGWALIGTPAEVRDGLQKYLDATGYQHVLLVMALPGLPTDLALRSMRMFAGEVAPAMEIREPSGTPASRR